MFGKNKRKTVIVDPRLQLRIILATSLPMVACLALALGGDVLLQHLAASGRIANDATILGMPRHRVGLFLLFVSASMWQLVSALLVSQKVAGTSYHIKRILREFLAGDPSARVRLRSSDYQHDLADAINAFLEKMDSHGASTQIPTKAGTASPSDSPRPDRRSPVAPPVREKQE